MLQVVQYQKSGEIKVESVPVPVCPKNGILVRTEYSLISAGTEKDSVSKAKSSLLARARKQPDDLKLVIEFIKKEGFLRTYQRIKSTLNSYKALGYSASGIVVESDSDRFRVGDRVAIGGAGLANHAEYNAIPHNLAVKLPNEVSFEDGAFTTVGAIAMQGVRQSEAKLGETVAVVGLGLIGLITVQLLKAAGCNVIGLDINESLFDKAKAAGCSHTFKSSKSQIKQIIAASGNQGCDSVIITAGTRSNEPVELAMEITRQRGIVVVVGAVGMDIPRNPFYRKEIDFRISCSYGPGRYDPNYEEVGIDYPFGYVRWTENRNMQSFVDLIKSNKLDLKPLTTHTYEVNDAKSAYSLVMGEIKEPFIGVLIRYNSENNDSSHSNLVAREFTKTEKPAISFVGAGTFAQNHLIPSIDREKVDFLSVATSKAVNAETARNKFGFAKCTSDAAEIINDKDCDAVFIATRHDSHGKYVRDSVAKGKAVFVEKPLAINQEELDKIKDAVLNNNGRVMVGFNRRFSYSFFKIKDFLARRSEPINMLYRVNAGFIPKSSWVQQSDQGGRIIGEVCHFIDTMMFLTEANPLSVFATSISSTNSETVNRDNISININFSDGSIGTILYFANGDAGLDKEYFEAHCENRSAVMNNFASIKLYRDGNNNELPGGNDKGIAREMQLTIESLTNGSEMPISFNEIYNVTATTFAINKSLQFGIPVGIKILK